MRDKLANVDKRGGEQNNGGKSGTVLHEIHYTVLKVEMRTVLEEQYFAAPDMETKMSIIETETESDEQYFAVSK